jgi:signal transduction histidine kinase
VIVVMAAWLAIGSTLFGAYAQISKSLDDIDASIPPFVAWMLYSIIINVAFFAGALFFGRRARAGAWQHDRLVEQTEQLKGQSAELARRAVVDERLRIARELHDVVAHHISAVGIQAAAARRVQAKAPDTAAELLTQVEGAARSALAETHALLGVLRAEPEAESAVVPDAASPASAPASPTANAAWAPGSKPDEAPATGPAAGSGTESESGAGAGPTSRPGPGPGLTAETGTGPDPVAAPAAGTGPSRAPEPGLAELDSLVEDMAPDIRVDLKRVEADGLPLTSVPAHLGLTLYRVVQEALTNVRRHSTARTATVTLRTGRGGGKDTDEDQVDWVEAEILDTGRALPSPRGPAGSGYGLEGIRERAALHVGVAEIGPRTGAPGFRVRLRVPLTRPETNTAPAPPRAPTTPTAPTADTEESR